VRNRGLSVLETARAVWNSPRWFVPRTVLGLILAWAILNLCFNLQREFAWRQLLPALDSTVLLAFYGVFALSRRRLSGTLHFVVALLILLSAMLRIADAVRMEYFHRRFNVSLDLPLIPGGIRLLYHSNPLSDFLLVMLEGALAFVAAVWLVQWASRHAWRAMRVSVGRRTFAVLVFAFVAFSVGPPWYPAALHARQLYQPFGESIVVRLEDEVDFALHAAGYKSDQLKDMKQVRQHYENIPTNLARLQGNTVLLFLIESYGYASFESNQQLKQFEPALKRITERAERAGFGIVSNFWDSPTYGAGSQFAQVTLNTGLRVEDDFQYRLVMSSDAPCIVDFFKRAGYRSLFVMPGTRYEWPAGEFYDFDVIYDRWKFDYAGPVIGWGEVPDQYTISFIHRKEVAPAKQPLFVEYALIGSHGPWHSTPAMIERWDRIGDGRIYNNVRVQRFPGLSWSNLKQAKQGYGVAINYDFDVLGSYLEQYVDGDALVIALGDHQPVVAVSGRGHPHSVPVHVFSRNKEYLEIFKRRGFTPGIVPKQPLPHQGMEQFLPQFLEDFSTPDGNPPRANSSSTAATGAVAPDSERPSNQ
jgi:hypothetical protein